MCLPISASPSRFQNIILSTRELWEVQSRTPVKLHYRKQRQTSMPDTGMTDRKFIHKEAPGCSNSCGPKTIHHIVTTVRSINKDSKRHDNFFASSAITRSGCEGHLLYFQRPHTPLVQLSTSPGLGYHTRLEPRTGGFAIQYQTSGLQDGCPRPGIDSATAGAM